MGFLKTFGRPLEWEESIEYFETLRKDAVAKIIYCLNTPKQNQNYSNPKFGYEVEFHKIMMDDENKLALIDLSGENSIMSAVENGTNNTSAFQLQVEFGKWMIECVPQIPLEYNKSYECEQSFKDLYDFMNENIGRNKILSISSYPMLGAKENYFISPDNIDEGIQNESQIGVYKRKESNEADKMDLTSNPFSNSQYIHDCIVNSHPRFGTLTKNIRQRRGNKVDIKIPIFKDIYTDYNTRDSEPYPGYIHMDAMAFGMGSGCLQITVGVSSLNQSMMVYDQMLPLTPILLAMTSSSPIFKGKLSAYDNRFSVICQAVDDRTEEEKNILSNNYIYKSRYSPCYSYISENVYVQDFHNDYPKMPINTEHYKTLLGAGVSKRLSEHFCNLLVRDPLVIFEKKIQINDDLDRTHFENFNSTNWNALRFKLSRPQDNDDCFKVEFRPCDLQLTAFENTAFVLLVKLIYSSLSMFDINFIMPITKVDENFNRAYEMDSIYNQKFFWRINGIDKNFNIITDNLKQNDYLSPHNNVDESIFNMDDDAKNIKELTIKEIFLGSDEYNYPGILKLCEKTIDNQFENENERNYLKRFLSFLYKRATGELWTDAKYIRNFVLKHPSYDKDSIVNNEINYDLVKHLLQIQNCEIYPEKLFGNFFV